jgi:hypothetical protein
MTVVERMLEQGKALVRAIEALETIEATGAMERGSRSPRLTRSSFPPPRRSRPTAAACTIVWASAT